MDQDIDRRADVDVARNGKAEHVPTADTAEQEPADADQKRDIRLTRRVHVVLGLVIAVLGAWLLLRSRAELAFRGPNGEPGPGYLPVLLTLCLVGLGLALSAVWLWGPKARTGEVPTLSLSPRHMARAVLVWLALVVCALLIEPLGFLLAGEVLVLLMIRRGRADPVNPSDRHAASAAAGHVLAVRHPARGATPGRNPVVLNESGRQAIRTMAHR
jgi:hypothetical protein